MKIVKLKEGKMHIFITWDDIKSDEKIKLYITLSSNSIFFEIYF